MPAAVTVKSGRRTARCDTTEVKNRTPPRRSDIHTYRTWDTTYFQHKQRSPHTHPLPSPPGRGPDTPTGRDLRGELDNRHQNKVLVYLGGDLGREHEQQAGQAARLKGAPAAAMPTDDMLALPCNNVWCCSLGGPWAAATPPSPTQLDPPPSTYIHIHTGAHIYTPHANIHIHHTTPYTQSVTATPRHFHTP